MRLRQILLALLVVASIVFAGGILMAHHAERQARDAWDRTGISADAFAALFPAHADSAAVKRLGELARPLGIEMRATARRPTRTDRSPDAEAALRRAQVAEFADRIAMKADDAPIAVPAEVAAFLSENAAALEPLIAHLALPAPLAWASDIRADVQAPVPPVAAVRQMNALVLAHSLAASTPSAARAGLAASEALVRSLGERPELSSQILAARLNRVRLGAHRHLHEPVASAPWPGADPRPAFLRSLQADAWAITHYVARTGGAALPGQSIDEGPVARYVVVPLSRPVLRFSAADYSQRMAAVVARLQADRTCGVGLERDILAAAGDNGSWNILARDAFPSVAGAWRTAHEAALDQELTALALAAQETDGAGSTPSGACPDRAWVRIPRAEGGMTLRLSAPPAASDPTRPPVTFTVLQDRSS